MINSTISLKAWWLVSVVSGFSATLSYTFSIFSPLPDSIRAILAFTFGLFLMAAVLAMYRLISHWHDSISLQIGTLFMLAAGIVATLMFVVQQASFTIHDQLQNTIDPSNVEQNKLMFKEVNAVQMGIDITWDIFLSVGTCLVALSIWQNPVFKRIMPFLGILFSVLLMIFNLYTFPMPPANSGLIDLGPVVATWWTILTILTLVRKKYFIEQ